MTGLDSFIQWCRIGAAKPFIVEGAHVLDIGCHQGELFRDVLAIASGLGMDPLVNDSSVDDRFRFKKGLFPTAIEDKEERFDTIVALAVFEHIPESEKEAFAQACDLYLKPGGRVIITVPSQGVDTILKVLLFFRLVDGMSLEEHHGFEPTSTPDYFLPLGLKLHHASTFELGLNHLFVFEKALRDHA